MQGAKSGRRDKDSERAAEKSEANCQRAKIDADASCLSLAAGACVLLFASRKSAKDYRTANCQRSKLKWKSLTMKLNKLDFVLLLRRVYSSTLKKIEEQSCEMDLQTESSVA